MKPVEDKRLEHIEDVKRKEKESKELWEKNPTAWFKKYCVKKKPLDNKNSQGEIDARRAYLEKYFPEKLERKE